MLHNLFIQANLNTLLYVCNVCARLFTLTNCTDVVHTPYMHNARVCSEKNETIVCLQILSILYFIDRWRCNTLGPFLS